MGAIENKQTALRFIEAQRTANKTELRKLVIDRFESRIPPSCEGIMGYPAVVKGFDDYANNRVKSKQDVYASEIVLKTKHIAAEGDVVMVFCEMRTTLPGGKPYENDYIFFFRFEGDRIAECAEHLDTAFAFQQYGFKITR